MRRLGSLVLRRRGVSPAFPMRWHHEPFHCVHNVLPLFRQNSCPLIRRLYGLYFFLGIFAPALRASLSAMATACFRLFTFLPLLDLRVPALCSFITLCTFSLPLPRTVDVRFAGIVLLSLAALAAIQLPQCTDICNFVGKAQCPRVRGTPWIHRKGKSRATLESRRVFVARAKR